MKSLDRKAKAIVPTLEYCSEYRNLFFPKTSMPQIIQKHTLPNKLYNNTVNACFAALAGDLPRPKCKN